MSSCEFDRVRSVMTFSDDPDASCRWWGAMLGVEPDTDGDFRWLELGNGVELGFHPAAAKNPFGASTVVYWQVPSITEALDRLTAGGALLHRGPLQVAQGRQIAQVRDPFGVVVGLDGP